MEKLEWLSILLRIGFHSMETRKVPLHDPTMETPPKYAGDFTHNHTANDSESGLDSNDLAIHNLYKQLGFLDDPQVSSLRSRLPSCSMFPLSPSHFDLFSPSNRLSLLCGDFIDTWLALLAGDDVAYLQEHEVFWHGVYDPQKPTDRHLAKNGFYESFPTLRGYHHKLEIARMNHQLARHQHRYHHIEYSLSFMGHSMEVVRSLLAIRALKIGGLSELEWAIRSEKSSNEAVPIGCLGDLISMELCSPKGKARFRRKDLQTCLLVDVQTLCQAHCLTNMDTSGVPIMLTILSFPSLQVKLGQASRSTVDGQHASCTVEIDPPSSHASNFVMQVIPIGASQCLSVVVSFQQMDIEDIGKTQVFVSIEFDDSTELRIFQWESWRDAFIGRLEGHSEWQRNHGLANVAPNWSSSRIADGFIDMDMPLSGTSGIFQTWIGWKPFRPEFLIFEIQSPGFLPHTQSEKSFFSEHYSWLGDDTTTGHFSYLERVTVPYSEAHRGVLRHACLVVKERLAATDQNEASLDSNAQGGHRQVILEQAMEIFSQPNGGPERAVFFIGNWSC